MEPATAGGAAAFVPKYGFIHAGAGDIAPQHCARSASFLDDCRSGKAEPGSAAAASDLAEPPSGVVSQRGAGARSQLIELVVAIGVGARSGQVAARVIAQSVRRQNIWRNLRRSLTECRPRLGVDVKRRACGVASADVRWSFV